MTFLELCQALRREAGISGTGPSSVDGQSGEMLRVVEWVRAANLEIQKMPYNWDFLWGEYALTLTEPLPGVFTQEYPLADLGVKNVDPASFYAYRPSVTAERWQLRNLPHVNWRRNYNSNVLTTGKLSTFTVKPNGTLRFDPIPDELFTVAFDYFREPQSLAVNTDVPLIPEDFHNIIVQKALMEYARYENAVEVYQGANTEYTRMLDDLKRQHILDVAAYHRPIC
jgi:hypothetical protein